jgi:hypothetical protein
LHELYLAMHSNYWQPGHPEKKSYYNYRGAFERVVDIENGHTLMDVAANYLHLYLHPGQHTSLSCRQLFTDSTSSPCKKAAYSSSDPTIANVTVDGVVTAGSHQSFATITLSDSGKTTAVRVWVRTSAAIPHFSGNGQMLDVYRPGQSVFVVAPFVLQPTESEGRSEVGGRSQARWHQHTLARFLLQSPQYPSRISGVKEVLLHC